MPVLLSTVADGVAVLTMNRPERRNALDRELTRALAHGIAAADGDEAVAVIVLTGADPAFCAGVDLTELGDDATASRNRFAATPGDAPMRPWPRTTKPVIGAVNGAAVTGGFELALQCDFLVASERATFGDTHTRVGIMPGWGLSVLLPPAIGLRRAKEMSLTGNFIAAGEALRLGLVNHVVAHDELLPFTLSLAADVAGNDARSVRALLEGYDAVAATTTAEGLRIEAARAADWNRDPAATADVARRRQAIIDRGRSQI